MKKTGKVNGGIPAKKLNFILAGVTFVISVILLGSTFLTAAGYRTLRLTTEEYLSWQESVNQMQYGSDYLTEQVRFFVEKGNRTYLDNYFNEAEVTKNRDEALGKIRESFSGTAAYRELNSAMNESVKLMNREYYAMRLKIEAMGDDVSAYPEAIGNVVLSESDAALSAAEKDALARALVFDDVYQEAKAEILHHTAGALRLIHDYMETRKINAANNLKNMIFYEMVLIIALIAMVALIVVLTTLHVISPLVKAVPNIKNEKPIPISGAAEFRFLAHTYNQMFEANNARKKQLSYAASHDYLTDLFNRSGFENEMKHVDLETSALAIIDVDHFKTANDTFGHEIGDAVLKKVAKAIKDNFRSYDIVTRFGGDEFAVLLLRVGNSNKAGIVRKVREINEILSKTADGTPAVTVSAGVAFGRGKDRSTLFKQADEALYATKNNGRRGVTFYGEETKPA